MYFDKEKYLKSKKDIYYEFDIFYETGKYLLDLMRNNNNNKVVLREPQYIVYFESFLLHYRNLYDFFIYEKHYPTDIYAKKIIINWNDIIQGKLNSNVDIIKSNVIDNNGKNRLNILLAHLTEERSKVSTNFEWNIQPLFENMSIIIEKFNECIEDLYPSIKNEIKENYTSSFSTKINTKEINLSTESTGSVLATCSFSEYSDSNTIPVSLSF